MGLSQTAFIKPGADMYDLNHVIVLKRSAEAGTTDDDTTSSDTTGGQ